jgi:hypothetical protein
MLRGVASVGAGAVYRSRESRLFPLFGRLKPPDTDDL